MSDHSDAEDLYEDLYLPGGSPDDAAAIVARWRPPEDGDQDAMLTFIREAAETLPPTAALNETMRQVEALPTAADLDAIKAQSEVLAEATSGMEEWRFSAADSAGIARIAIRFDGEPEELELTQAAVAARSARAVSAALVEAWAAAVAQRDEKAEELNRAIARFTGDEP